MEKLKILLAKGRIYDSVCELLNDVGITINLPDRTYFPTTNQEDLAFQVVKPQITSALLAQNKADVGFSGKDWVYENGVQDDVIEIMDLGFDPVRIVAAIPERQGYDCNRIQCTHKEIHRRKENRRRNFPHMGNERRLRAGQ